MHTKFKNKFRTLRYGVLMTSPIVQAKRKLYTNDKFKSKEEIAEKQAKKSKQN